MCGLLEELLIEVNKLVLLFEDQVVKGVQLLLDLPLQPLICDALQLQPLGDPALVWVQVQGQLSSHNLDLLACGLVPEVEQSEPSIVVVNAQRVDVHDGQCHWVMPNEA